jgi:3-oxoacyl-(acyl-carrier-protein) synthase/pimeloyl-ACP methyl ester carboxylesterase/acyl carrier protein
MAKGFSGNFKLFADAISVDLLKEFGFTPFDIVFVEELTLPRTNTGKVQILKSKELYEKDAIPGLYRTRGVAAPQVPNTSTLRQQDQNSSIHAGGDQELFEFLVSEVRKINHALVLKRETPIHDLGLDSLTLNYLQAEIAARFKVDLDPTLFFACKTVQELMDQVMAVGATGGVSSSRTTSQPKAASEAIAIIGVSVQLPGSQDPDEFWEHLKNAKDLITEIPKERWDWQAQAEAHPEFADRLKWGGFIEGVDQFDHNFFGISPKEASLMDPQQRLLLQTAWRTMESAGYRASALKGRPLGVYVGASTQDYANLVQASQDRVHPFSVTGNAKNMLSNRISHFFDFTGPSEVIDTACSSSLVALHRAVRAIRAGECEMALAGGINLLLIPDIHLALSQAGMLSPEGRCKTFDAQAQGYVRSEGVGLYLLKPLSQAEKDNDHVLGVILGSAVNHGGRAASLTAPDRNAQTRLLLEAWRDAGIRPGDLDYIETHGTGTSLGDPIEVGAIKQAMAQDESMPSQSVCYLGAVKTICGHLEAAAGVAGLAKVLLSLENGWIPPSLHLRETNSLLKLEGSRLKIASNGMAWPAASGYDHRPRIAGISSFGFGGSNAHLVVSEYRRATRDQVIHQDESPAVILLSANSETALEARVQSLLKFLRSEAGHAVDVHQLAKNLYFGRESFRFRLALEATHCHELIGKLETWNQSKRSQPILQLETKASTDPILFAAISRWVHGEDVALDSHFGSPAYKKLRLPTYSFDGVKHWVKPESQGLGQSGKVAGRQADQERGWLQHYLGIHGSLESALCHLIIDQVSSCLALSSQNLQESTDLSLLGLDSIAAMQVLSSLSSQLEIRLSPSHYHGMSTPIDLARAILIHHGAELIKTQHPKPISFHSQPIIAPGVELLALEQWSTSNQSAQVQDRSQDFEVLSLLALDKVLKSNSQLQARLLVTLRNRRHMELLIGGSGSTLVFLPAFGMNSSQWHPQFEYFSQNHRVVAVTLPGFGRSQRPEKADFEAMVAMLTEALDRIGASRDINLVGSSFGGLIARKFTQNHPKRVASLTMVNSPLAMEKMPSLESFRTGLAHELMELFDSEQRAIYEHAVDLIDVDYYRQLLQSQAAGDTAGLSLPVPTLIVTGKKDGIQSWEKIEAVFRNQEQVEVQVLEQSGHFPNISHRDDFNHMLGRFVARGEVFEYLPPGTKQLLS